MFAHCNNTNTQDLYCWQWANLTMAPNVSLYIHVVAHQRGLPSLNGKLEPFVTNKMEKRLQNSYQTNYSEVYNMMGNTLVLYCWLRCYNTIGYPKLLH